MLFSSFFDSDNSLILYLICKIKFLMSKKLSLDGINLQRKPVLLKSQNILAYQRTVFCLGCCYHRICNYSNFEKFFNFVFFFVTNSVFPNFLVIIEWTFFTTRFWIESPENSENISQDWNFSDYFFRHITEMLTKYKKIPFCFFYQFPRKSWKNLADGFKLETDY